jgi:hypothetical protein
LAANIGVLAGIIFLAFELQQNTVATRLEAASNFQSSFNEVELLIAASPEFAELVRKGREGDDTSATDQLRLFVFYNNVLRQWQFHHFQYLSDALDEDNWQANRAFMAQILGGDRGLMNHWRSYKHQYSSAFNNMLESITEELQQE